MWKKIEKKLGNLKFAVVVIGLFTLAMIVGTFVESYQGTEFANRLIYKSVPFMILQFCMFLSIYCATTLRLPPRKKLYGFYLIHSALIITFAGSFITWYAGVDGNITLYPNSPSKKISLSEDVLKMSYHGQGKVVTFALPANAFASNLNEVYQGIALNEYLPYSESKTQWVANTNSQQGSDQGLTSSSYFISNSNVSQEFTLSINPAATEFQPATEMGPLSVYYLHQSMAPCFQETNPSGLFFWDSEKNICFTPEERKIPIKEVNSKKRFLALKDEQGIVSVYFPEVSPWPLTQDLKNIQKSNTRIFSKRVFQEKPALFLFGKKLAFFSDEQWHVQQISKEKSIDLPWMGFSLSLLRHEHALYPERVPHYITPIQKNNELIRGAQKALSLKVQDKSYWVTDQKPITLLIDEDKVTFEIIKKSINLPFEFNLTRFQMNKDPGTNNPASYESFVRLFTKDGPENHHIYMNNPLKHRGFTFYQASYFPVDDTNFGSVLSANVDQGRPIKYLGSLLLVLGAIWHFHLNKRNLNKLKLKRQKVASA